MKMTRAASGNGIYSVMTFCIVMLLAACGRGGGNDKASDEGTLEAPITLTVGTSHNGSINKFGTSYYRFTTASNSIHRISLTDTESDLYWTLFSGSTFSGFILECDASDRGDEICTSPSALTAGTTYYFTVDEFGNLAGTYKLQVDAI